LQSHFQDLLFTWGIRLRFEFLMQALLVKLHFATGGHGSFSFARLCQSLLKIGNQLEDAVLGLARALLTFVPIRDRSTQINSLDLLDESADDFEIFVANGPNSNKIYVDLTYHITTGNSRMFFGEFFISHARYNKLVLPWLTPIHVIVGVEE